MTSFQRLVNCWWASFLAVGMTCYNGSWVSPFEIGLDEPVSQWLLSFCHTSRTSFNEIIRWNNIFWDGSLFECTFKWCSWDNSLILEGFLCNALIKDQEGTFVVLDSVAGSSEVSWTSPASIDKRRRKIWKIRWLILVSMSWCSVENKYSFTSTKNFTKLWKWI